MAKLKTKAIPKKQDETTAAIYAAVKAAFPDTSNKPEDVVYRVNIVSIRVLIVSLKFEGKSESQREAIVKRALKLTLPKEIWREISLLIMLTPEEFQDPEDDLMLLEFLTPDGTYL